MNKPYIDMERISIFLNAIKKIGIYGLIITGLVFSWQVTSAQEIPNAGFENWVDHGSYQDPAEWDTPNEELSFLNIAVVMKEESIVHSGNASAMLQTKDAEVEVIPGFATTGEFTMDPQSQEYSITGGIAFEKRPSSVQGYFQYVPENNDTCSVGGLLTKGSGNNKDTIGIASFFTTQTVNSWTRFKATFTYLSTEDPDTLNILAISSSATDPQPGSRLYIDDLELKYSTGINEPALAEHIHINPHSQPDRLDVEFDFHEKKRLTISIYDLRGKEITRLDLGYQHKGHQAVNLNGLSSQAYIIKINAGRQVLSKKIIL
ncbi:MAG: PCMD domain-containing protein [Bacteroidales bacterium]|nr:PCMD domain-containing protein [Bacteroidales bacterium]